MKYVHSNYKDTTTMPDVVLVSLLLLWTISHPFIVFNMLTFNMSYNYVSILGIHNQTFTIDIHFKALTCSKSTLKTPEKYLKYAQSSQ